MVYRDRQHAGKKLAPKLAFLKGSKGLVVLAVSPRGLPVAKPLANYLDCSLKLFMVEPVVLGTESEVPAAWVTPDGRAAINQKLVRELEVSGVDLDNKISQKKKALSGLKKNWRPSRRDLGDKRVVLVDDGVVTGQTIKAAIAAIRQYGPKKVIVSVPVIAKETLGAIEAVADEVEYLQSPELFISLSEFYQKFPDLSYNQAIKILK